jgi:TRAP-type C4-dicarboxylate transport system permease large subunit
LPDAVILMIGESGIPPILVIWSILILYILLGAVFDEVATMIITLPVVFPLVVGLGYDPIWWGIINIMIIEIGLIAPPIGINVFVIHGMLKKVPLGTIYRGIMPFFLADMLRLALLVSFPLLTLWLPAAMKLPK